MDFVWMIIGIIQGVISSFIVFYFKTAFGTLRIDHSNSEKDVYRIEIADLDKISKAKKLILKVDNNADLSQK